MKKLNRTGKYFVLACVILILMNAFLGLLLTRQMSKAMQSLIQNRMLDISNTAAAMLDGDALARVQAEDVDSASYQQILKTLTYFQENIELAYIYCVRDMGDNTFVFTIDPTVGDPAEFGMQVVCTPALCQASRGIASVDETPYTDDWGTFYSSYSPVFGSDGSVAGIVVVDFSTDWYDRQVARSIRTTGIIIALAATISITISLLIATSYKKKATVLIQQLKGLSEGIETLIHDVAPDAQVLDENATEAAIKVSWEEALVHDEIVALSDNIRSMQERLRTQIAFVESRAFFDGLTGFKNRTAYEEDIAKLDSRVQAGDAVFSIALFDINQLKIINDDFGHEEGDRIILMIAREIQEVFSKESMYRIGGDEFVVLLDGEDPTEDMKKLRKKLELLSAKEVQLKAHAVDVAVSMGCAIFDPSVDASYAGTFQRADTAMYADKKVYYETHEDRRARKIWRRN